MVDFFDFGKFFFFAEDMKIFVLLLITYFTTAGVVHPKSIFTLKWEANQCIDLPNSAPLNLCARLWNRTSKTDYNGKTLNATEMTIFLYVYNVFCDIDDNPNLLRLLCSRYAPPCIDKAGKESFVVPPCRNLCQEALREFKRCYSENNIDLKPWVMLDCNFYSRPHEVENICVPAIWTF